MWLEWGGKASVTGGRNDRWEKGGRRGQDGKDKNGQAGKVAE